jgi:hypothetical protein
MRHPKQFEGVTTVWEITVASHGLTATMKKTDRSDLIVDFWQWYRRRQEQQYNPLASLALDKCEEAFARCDWNSFGYWHTIYLREGLKRRAIARGTPR